MSTPAVSEPPTLVDAHFKRAVAVLAGCDPRSVAKHLNGERVRPICAMRITRALRELERRGVLVGAADQT